MNIGFSKDQIIDLLNILRYNNNIKKLIYNAYLINKEKILLLANFLEEPECHITSIGFVNPYLMYYGQKNLYLILQKLSYSFRINNSLKEIILSNICLSDNGFSVLLDSLSQKLDLESLKVINICIKLEKEEVLNKFNKYIINSNLKELNISKNPVKQESLIKLLEVIKDKNILNILDISSIFLSNNNSIDAVCSLFAENTRIREFTFSLDQITLASKEKLLICIGKNKALINCKIERNRDCIKEVDKLQNELNKITTKNKEIFKKVIQVLKDLYEAPNNLEQNNTHSYLKLYKKLDLYYLKIKLEELKITSIDSIIQNADRYINKHFFEMSGIAKQPKFGDLPEELIGCIASYLEFSDINFIN